MMTSREYNDHLAKLRRGIDTLVNWNKFADTNDPNRITARRLCNLRIMMTYIKSIHDDTMEQAMRDGVIPNTKDHPMTPGTRAQCYTDDDVSISLDVANPSTSVKIDKMRVELIKRGVSTKVIDEATKAATVTQRAGHKYTADLRVEIGSALPPVVENVTAA